MTDPVDIDLVISEKHPDDVLETIPRPARLGALMVFGLAALGVFLLIRRLVHYGWGVGY